MDKDKIKYDENGYVVIDDFLPVDVYNEIVDIFLQDEYVEIAQSFDDSYELWMNNDKYFGVTVHFMNEKIDNGKIIFTMKLKIKKTDNIQSLIQKTDKISPRAGLC